MRCRGAVALLSLAILLGGCATTSPSPSASPTTPASAPASASATLAGSPPGDLVFRLERQGGIGKPVPYLTLYADGRLLSFDAQEGRFWVRTLSETGIDAILAEVVASGSFDASHDVPLEPLPGVEQPGMEVPLDRFILAADAEARIEVTNVPFNDVWIRPSSERDDLMALAERLLALDWLGADAWVEENPVPYAPDAYLVFSGFIAFPPQDPICQAGSEGGPCDREITTEVWPVSLPPDGIGMPFQSADGTESTIDHCAVIDVAFAEALAAAMLQEPQLTGGLAGLSYVGASIPWRERNGFYELQLRPLLPEESATCAGKSLPG